MIKFLILFTHALLPMQDTDSLLTEEMAVKIALEKNFDIRLEAYNLEIAENNNTLGNAGMLPTVELTGGARQSVQDTEQEFISGDTQSRQGAKTTNYDAGGNLSWTLFDGFKMFATKERLEELGRVNEALFRLQVQNSISDVQKAFYNAALEQERLSLLESNLKLSEERVQISKDKYEVGKASKLEYLQAQVDYNTDQSALVKQQEVIIRRRLELWQLMGIERLEDTVRLQYAYGDLYAFGLPEEIESTAVRQNPQLQYLRGQQEVALLTTKERERELYPSLDFNLGYNYSNLSAEAGFLQKNQTNGFNYGLSATMTVFDGMNQRRAIQNARIQTEYALTAYEQAEAQLRTSVKSGVITLRNAITLLNLERENLGVAQENVDIALERYRIGMSNPLEIREAQNNALNAEIRYAEARNSAKIAEIELLRLTGTLIGE